MKKIKAQPPILHKTTIINGVFCILCQAKIESGSQNKVICQSCQRDPQLQNIFCNFCGISIHENISESESLRLYQDHFDQDYFCGTCCGKHLTEQVYDQMYERFKPEYYAHFEIEYCSECNTIEKQCTYGACVFSTKTPSNLNNLKAFGAKSINRLTLARPSNLRHLETEVFFDNISGELKKRISEADAVLGCICYITDTTVLEELSRKDCKIIMQKPKKSEEKETKSFGRDSILMLSSILNNSVNYSKIEHFPKDHFTLDQTAPLRMIGSEAGYSLMHHKFMIFLRHVETYDKNEVKDQESAFTLKPYAVWTGSFNFTYNASRNLENAVLIKDELVVLKYLEEYAFCLSVSEAVETYSSELLPDLTPGSIKISDIYLDH